MTVSEAVEVLGLGTQRILPPAGTRSTRGPSGATSGWVDEYGRRQVPGSSTRPLWPGCGGESGAIILHNRKSRM